MSQEKAKIITVGYVINGKIEKWRFTCEGKVPLLNKLGDGTILVAGYSIAELEDISRNFWGEKNGREKNS